MKRKQRRRSAETLPMMVLCFVAALGCQPVRHGLPAGPATQPMQGTGLPSDTAAPEMPKKLLIRPDTTLVVSRPDSGDIYYRTLVQVAFDDTTRGISIKRVFFRFQATVVGGYPKQGPRGTYVIQVADRGPKWEPLAALVDSLRAEPGVFSAGPMQFRARMNERDSL